MQYDVQSPQEYMESLDDDWRRAKLQELRTLIHSHGPDLVEGISYKMLSYSDERGAIFGLNAQKHYVSLYVGDASKIDPDGSLLRGLNVGKGCIRVTKSIAIAATGLEEFIERTIRMRKHGEDIGC
jgi:uncharacterized protein YdhG (YjbR/CyaY superfamily)